jgi:hypothetical protein
MYIVPKAEAVFSIYFQITEAVGFRHNFPNLHSAPGHLNSERTPRALALAHTPFQNKQKRGTDAPRPQ